MSIVFLRGDTIFALNYLGIKMKTMENKVKQNINNII